MISRRNFVKIAGTLPILTAGEYYSGSKPVRSAFPTVAAPAIKSITLMKVSGSFDRFVGMNAYDQAPKGVNKVQQLARVTLADGTEGLSVVGYTNIDKPIIDRVRELIGKDPFGFYNWDGDSISGVIPSMKPYFFDTRYAWIEGAFLDVIGKLKNAPVWKLFGKSLKEGIDAYDGSLYFEDIAHDRDVSIIADIGRRMKNEGYRGIKMKLGRPSKWLKGEAGVERDIEAFIALREAVGWNFNIMTDANNGYKDQFSWAVKLMKSCAPYDMYWMEELFPDDTALYLKLRDELLKDNFFIPIAEGEGMKELDHFDRYFEDGVYNYLQPDMRTCGMSNILNLAGKAEKYPHVKIIPHNWQSQFGLVMSLHASKVSNKINFVEDDRFFTHALSLPKYQFRDGQWFVPDEPGWGVALAPDYKQFLEEEEILIT
ncbi:MAG TPA: mandelate racemase/muconate lactonizing enzyme family protein [Anseongella sp.]|nr:mandelate racemase/muconate lactonizing enzyme family protein [Anseongella sp.]